MSDKSIQVICCICNVTKYVTEKMALKCEKRKYYVCGKSCETKRRWANKTEKEKEEQKQRFLKSKKKWELENPKKLSEKAKIARSKVKISGKELVRRQYATLKNDPILWKNFCEKRKKISLDFHKNMSYEEKEIYYKKIFKNNVPKSKTEIEFFQELESNNIQFEYDVCLFGFFPDGVDYENKLIIEFYGDVYHCNPKKFTSEQYCSWLKMSVQEKWDIDRKRLAVFYNNGYDVLIVWESDWHKNKIKEIGRINNALREKRICRNNQ